MKVVKEVDFGMYLDGGEEGEVLLPARYVPASTVGTTLFIPTMAMTCFGP